MVYKFLVFNFECQLLDFMNGSQDYISSVIAARILYIYTHSEWQLLQLLDLNISARPQFATLCV